MPALISNDLHTTYPLSREGQVSGDAAPCLPVCVAVAAAELPALRLKLRVVSAQFLCLKTHSWLGIIELL